MALPATTSAVDQTAINNNFIATIKSSVIFDNNWNAPLNAIPTSLGLMAKANMYAALPASAHIDFGDVKNFSGFGSTTLPGCLTEIVGKVLLAFDKAETDFKGISGIADDVFSNLTTNIFPGLADLETNPSATALQFLKNSMADLGSEAATAKEHVTTVSAMFDEILSMALELNRAAVEKGAISGKEAKNAQLQAYAKAYQLQGQQLAVESSKSALETTKGTLAVAQAAYKKASDDFPSTMQVMGDSIAMAFTDCLTSAIAQVVPALVQNMTTVGKAEGGLKALTTAGTDITNTAEGKNDVPDNAPPKTVDTPNDPGYALALKDSPLLNQLGNIINNGPGNGVDWKIAKTAPPPNDQSEGKANSSASEPDMLTYLIDQLDFSKQNSGLGTTAPSTELSAILDKGLTVARAVEASAKGSTGLPAAASRAVAGWQQDIKDVVSRISALCAQANSLPGTGGALGATQKQPTTTTAAANSSTAAAKILLDFANAQLTQSQLALTASVQAYSTQSTKLSEDQAALGKVKSELTMLSGEEHILDEVVAVLTLITTVFVDFKTDVNKLTLHFQALSEMVNMVIDHDFNRFMGDLDAEVADADTSVAKGGPGGISMSDFGRHSLYVAGCTLAAYFDMFGGITSTWVKTSAAFVTSSDGGSDGGISVVSHAGLPFPFSTQSNTGPNSSATASNTAALANDTASGLLDSTIPSATGIDAVSTAGDTTATSATPVAPVDRTGADGDPVVQAEITNRLAIIAAWVAKTSSGLDAVISASDARAKKHMDTHLMAITQLMNTPTYQAPPPHVLAGLQKGTAVVRSAVANGINSTVPLTTIPGIATSSGPITFPGGGASRGSDD